MGILSDILATEEKSTPRPVVAAPVTQSSPPTAMPHPPKPPHDSTNPTDFIAAVAGPIYLTDPSDITFNPKANQQQRADATDAFAWADLVDQRSKRLQPKLSVQEWQKRFVGVDIVEQNLFAGILD